MTNTKTTSRFQVQKLEERVAPCFLINTCDSWGNSGGGYGGGNGGGGYGGGGYGGGSSCGGGYGGGSSCGGGSYGGGSYGGGSSCFGLGSLLGSLFCWL